jgi:hypothetical protein
MNDERGGVWRIVNASYFKRLGQYLSGRSKEIHEKSVRIIISFLVVSSSKLFFRKLILLISAELFLFCFIIHSSAPSINTV